MSIAEAPAWPPSPTNQQIGAFPIMTDLDRHQSFSQWQQASIQEPIPRESPFTPADEQFLLETFTECRVKLSEALKVAQGYSRLPDLAAGVGDALQGIHDAAAVVVEPETYLE